MTDMSLMKTRRTLKMRLHADAHLHDRNRQSGDLGTNIYKGHMLQHWNTCVITVWLMQLPTHTFAGEMAAHTHLYLCTDCDMYGIHFPEGCTSSFLHYIVSKPADLSLPLSFQWYTITATDRVPAVALVAVLGITCASRSCSLHEVDSSLVRSKNYETVCRIIEPARDV